MSRPGGLQLSPVQIIAALLATLTGAILASYLGVGGTLVGAAVGSIASTTGTEVYRHYLRRSQERLKAAGEVLRHRQADSGQHARHAAGQLTAAPSWATRPPRRWPPAGLPVAPAPAAITAVARTGHRTPARPRSSRSLPRPARGSAGPVRPGQPGPPRGSMPRVSSATGPGRTAPPRTAVAAAAVVAEHQPAAAADLRRRRAGPVPGRHGGRHDHRAVGGQATRCGRVGQALHRDERRQPGRRGRQRAQAAGHARQQPYAGHRIQRQHRTQFARGHAIRHVADPEHIGLVGAVVRPGGHADTRWRAGLRSGDHPDALGECLP